MLLLCCIIATGMLTAHVLRLCGISPCLEGLRSGNLQSRGDTTCPEKWSGLIGLFTPEVEGTGSTADVAEREVAELRHFLAGFAGLGLCNARGSDGLTLHPSRMACNSASMSLGVHRT